MSLVQQVARVNANAENTARANEFVSLAKFLLSNDGRWSNARVALQANGLREGNLGPKLSEIVQTRVCSFSRQDMLRTRTAQSAQTLSALSDYSIISQGFVNSLANAGCFDGMLSSLVPTPLRTGTVGAVSVGASAFSISEGSAKPISRLTIVNQQQNPTKVACAVVVTQELAKMAGPNARALIGVELRQAVAITADTAFVATLISGLSVTTSTGSTAESVRIDIANLLRAVTVSQASKLFILTTPLVCKTWCMLTDSKGISAFPDLTPTGGSIQGITVLTSDGITAGNVILADSSGIAGASGDVLLDQIQEGTLQFESSAPDSPPTASTNYIGLWQNNMIAIRVERYFVGARLRADAVAVCNNANSYGSGNSPP